MIINTKSESREYIVAFKATDTERKRLKTLAKLYKTTVSDLIRHALDNHLNPWNMIYKIKLDTSKPNTVTFEKVSYGCLSNNLKKQ